MTTRRFAGTRPLNRLANEVDSMFSELFGDVSLNPFGLLTGPRAFPPAAEGPHAGAPAIPARGPLGHRA